MEVTIYSPMVIAAIVAIITADVKRVGIVIDRINVAIAGRRSAIIIARITRSIREFVSISNDIHMKTFEVMRLFIFYL